MSAADLAVTLHLAATAFMTGLIWFVQVVHYPLFSAVAAEGYAAYQKRHMTLTTIVVAPGMLVELAAALWILAIALPAGGAPAALAIAGAALLAAIWGSTFFVQVPCHGRLAEGFDARAHRRLVRSAHLDPHAGVVGPPGDRRSNARDGVTAQAKPEEPPAGLEPAT